MINIIREIDEENYRFVMYYFGHPIFLDKHISLGYDEIFKKVLEIEDDIINSENVRADCNIYIDRDFRLNCLAEEKTESSDPINHPSHYTQHGIECIQVTEMFGFCLGNVIKYVWRAGLKPGNTRKQDLLKAKWYLERELSKEE